MKTWKRGRKPATEEQKESAKLWQNERVKIANLVARKPEIEKICCICGEPAKIFHNRKKPYYITFICDTCRKNKCKLAEAEKHRFDIRDNLNKSNLSASNFTDEEVRKIVEGYFEKMLSIGDYCDSLNISRHQFNKLLSKYKKINSSYHIKRQVKVQSNIIQHYKIKRISKSKRKYGEN